MNEHVEDWRNESSGAGKLRRRHRGLPWEGFRVSLGDLGDVHAASFELAYLFVN